MKKDELRNKHNQKLRLKGITFEAIGDYITGVSNPKQEYKCVNGHTIIADRARTIAGKTNCPSCPGKDKRRNTEGYKADIANSGFTLLDIYRGADIRILHKCSNGHETRIRPSSILRGNGCAVCSGVAKKTTEQYEKELWEKCIPYTICEEYNGVMKKADHKCLECGHVWKVKPHDILHGNGCPVCAKTGFKPNKPAILYYARVWDETTTLYKIGITNKPRAENRLRFCGKKYKLLMERKFDTGKEALAAETMILEEYADMKVYAPQFMPNGGYTELFRHDILLLENSS